MLHAYDHVTDDLPIKAQWSETSLSFCGKCCGNLEENQHLQGYARCGDLWVFRRVGRTESGN